MTGPVWPSRVLCVAIALAPVWLSASPMTDGQVSAIAERMARVESGLLPRVVPSGERGRRMSIAERMAYHGVAGLSVAVVHDGRVAWARGYGVRRRGGSPVTPESLFQAASLSKSVSALGALLLVQQQRIELDADVRRWLRTWQPPDAMTLRQLLSHTAGLNDVDFLGYAPGAALPSLVQVLNGQPPANNQPVKVLAQPGARVQYSGLGYLAVQQLIADVSQEGLGAFMHRNVFVPLEMSHSTFDQPLSADAARSAASGHRRDGTALTGGWMVQPELAAAGLWTTPTDLARFLIEIQDGASGHPTRLLKPDLAREMLTARLENVGLGFFLTGPNGASRRFTHSGRNAGFDARLVGYKNGRDGAVVMINRNNNGGFIDEVLESIAREYQWPDYLPESPQLEHAAVPSPVQKAYSGVYRAPGVPAATLVFEDDKLFARVDGDVWVRLYPASNAEFFTAENGSRWTFATSPDGRVIELVTRSGGQETRRSR